MRGRPALGILAGVLSSLPLAAPAAVAATIGKEARPSPILAAMGAELARWQSGLKDQPKPPYFLSYEITETQSAFVSAAFGALTQSTENHRRMLDVDVRVGDYALDNTRALRGGAPSFMDRFTAVEVPVDDSPDAIRSVLWAQTDRKYKRALEQLTAVETNVRVKVEQEDKSADFAKEPAAKATEPPASLKVDRKAWEQKVRKFTAPFARHGDIYEANAFFLASVETRYYVNSEGTTLQTSQPSYRLFISAFTKAEDGMELPRYESYFAFTPEGLPDEAAVLKVVDGMISDLEALRAAPVVDPYTGPAILSGRAAGVFFHEVFGHRIEGHRLKREEDAQTFKKKVNDQVLPETFSVVFDPTLTRMGNADLVGAYKFDNEGVASRRVTVVENGVFKSFLMSRTPIEGFPDSNGHGRKQVGFAPVARQSNLLVEVKTPLSHEALVKALIDEVRKEGKPFGLVFDDIQGGFTLTGRTIPNAFNVLPVMVYRISPDGKRELVRGVDLIGTPLTAFSKIVAADDQVGVFNGVCGAESGGVPVSAAAPGVLISQIEVQKKQKSSERPPLLPAPFEDKK
jgi:TldD protein